MEKDLNDGIASMDGIQIMSTDDSGRDHGQKVGRRIQYLFPEAAIALDTEIQMNHPELLRILSKYPHQLLENKVAAIAAYCNLAVDGNFKEKDLEALFQMLYDKLKEKSRMNLN